MTIKIEQETLLRVLERSSSSGSSQPQQASHPPLETALSPVEGDYLLVDLKPLSSNVEKLRQSSTEDDDTLSTASLSSDSDCGESFEQRRVSFATDLVTAEWTRPFTPKEEVAQLFYSTEETSRFRQEYRLERKLLSELSIDPETFSVDENDLSALVSATPSSQPAYRISRVVVLHNDKLETFVDQEKEQDFFDNDSFWSGSITWY